VKRVAARLSASGFAVAILDYFAREGRCPDISTPAAIDVAVNLLPDDRVIADARGLIGALREHQAIDPERIGSLGFCIGGMYSLMLSAEAPNLSASVDYYGSVRFAKTSDREPVSPLDRARDIQAPFLAHFGTFDRLISAEDSRRSRPNSSARRGHTNFSPTMGRLTPSMKTFGLWHIAPSHRNSPGSAR
jgi:carboxymethylenebutenolidase